MKGSSLVIVALMSITLLHIVLPPIVYANAAEPPSFTVIVANPPEDLSLSLLFSDSVLWSDGGQMDALELAKEKKAWETYYRFFYHMLPSGRDRLADGLKNALLMVENGGQSLAIPLPSDTFSMYNNLLTLDMEAEILTVGQSAHRVPFLVTLRLVLTLVIEGIIFFLFGYRKKRSWQVFLLVNILTQGGLNVLITGPGIGPYWMIGFVLGELVILGAEMIAFLKLVQEQKKSRTTLYTVTANVASLILGGYLISYLPV
ncbi:MAG: hypothetical protein GX349_02860 [Firmicutes bacterium]|nr:hypothetical protein [Bacillota bacterium]